MDRNQKIQLETKNTPRAHQANEMNSSLHARTAEIIIAMIIAASHDHCCRRVRCLRCFSWLRGTPNRIFCCTWVKMLLSATTALWFGSSRWARSKPATTLAQHAWSASIGYIPHTMRMGIFLGKNTTKLRGKWPQSKDSRRSQWSITCRWDY